MKRIYIFVFILVLIVFGVVAYNFIFQEHRDIRKESPVNQFSSQSLVAQFQNTEVPNILNETLLVSGTITKIEEEAIILDDKVYCNLNSETKSALSIGKVVMVKGRCLGYDELFEVVKLDQCYLIN